jgi:hypothetical protein
LNKRQFRSTAEYNFNTRSQRVKGSAQHVASIGFD